MDVHSLPEIQEIVGYLQNMKFKNKILFGCDRESVLTHFREVTRMYEGVVTDLNSRVEELEQSHEILNQNLEQMEEERKDDAERIAQLKKRYEKAAYAEQLTQSLKQIEMERKNDTQRIEQLQERLSTASTSEQDYLRKSQQLAEALEQVQLTREAVLEQAKLEADEMIREARIQSQQERLVLDKLRKQRQEMEKEWSKYLIDTSGKYHVFCSDLKETIGSIKELEERTHHYDGTDSSLHEERVRKYPEDRRKAENDGYQRRTTYEAG